MSILLSEATHEQAMSYMKKILNNWKRDIVEVTFVKKGNKRIRRKMKVHFDEDFVKKATNGRFPEHVAKIKATNKERDNMVVCEMLPSGKYRFRTIPLRNVLRIRVVKNPKTSGQKSEDEIQADSSDKELSESLISEYDGNKYFVRVNPRVQKYGQSTGWEGVNFNEPGPHMGSRGDCVVRALALATGLSYINVARKLRIQLDDKNDVPGVFNGYVWEDVYKYFHQTYKISDVRFFGELLKSRLHKTMITVKEFAQTISRHQDFKNRYLIIGCTNPAYTQGHAVFIKNGRYYDEWDCGDWIVRDVFDATNERRPTAYDFRNIVRIRRGIKTRFHEENEN